MAETAEMADFLYRYAGTITVVIMIILIAMFASQQAPSNKVTAEESPFVMEPGIQYPVSQLLEEQNREGVFMLPLTESCDGKHQLPTVRNIYFSQRLGDKTTVMMTGISEPFTVLEITLYDNTGEIIYEDTVVSQPYPLVPREASLVFTGFTGREGTRILDERILALIPSSKFEEAKTISIKYL